MVAADTVERCVQCGWPLAGEAEGGTHCRSCMPPPRVPDASIRRPLRLVLGWMLPPLLAVAAAALLWMVWRESTSRLPIDSDAELAVLAIAPILVGVAIGQGLRMRRAVPGPWWERRFVYTTVCIVGFCSCAMALLRLGL